MKKSDGSTGFNTLKRENIIRGFRIFLEILKDSKVIQTGYIKAYVRTKKRESLNKNLISPLVTDNVKVGFIIGKKNIKKSFFRNRLKRLLRESFRKFKLESGISKDIFIIYTLTSDGYEYFKKFPFTKNKFVDIEMKKVNIDIKSYLEKK